MNDTTNTVAGMKAGLATKMKDADQAAFIWSQSTFDATGYPLITTPDGANHPVYGIMLTDDDLPAAIIQLPSGLTVHGLLVISPVTNRRPLAEAKSTTAGTPSQWAILCDCYESASQNLKAEQVRNEPLPWW